MGDLEFSHGGDIFSLKSDVIDFSSNINPLPLPDYIKRKFEKNIEKIKIYPDNFCREITKAVSEYLDIREENIIFGNGSIELIYLFFLIFKPYKILIPVPTFSEYERCAKLHNVKIEFLYLDDDFNLKLNLKNKKFDSIILCNPNNPTGNLIISKEDLEKFEDKLVLIDESFIEFVENETFIYKAVKRKNIIVLRSFSKFWGFAGLRVGYIVSNEIIINKFKDFKVPWSVNGLAQIILPEILRDKKYISKTYKLIKKEKEFLYNEISKICGLKIYPSVTNFFLIKIEREDLNSKILKEELIKEGILIRDCSNFKGLNEKFFRISIRNHNENLKLINSLKKIWKI